MILHNYGNHAPPNLNESPWTDGVNLSRAVWHSALPILPAISELDSIPGAWKFDNPYSLPPSQVAACLLTRTFKVNASISAGTVGISISDGLAKVKFGETEVLTIGEFISDDYRFCNASLSDSDSDEDASMTFSFSSPSATRTLWIRETSEWTLSGVISISYNGPETVDAAVLSNLQTTAAFPDTGVVVTFFGKELPLYARRSEDVGLIAGTITIEAEDYFSPINAP